MSHVPDRGWKDPLPFLTRGAASIRRYLAEALADLVHANGSAVCELYGAHAPASGFRTEKESKQHSSRRYLLGAVGQGPVVAFNLFRSCGAYVGYRWEPGSFHSLHESCLADPCLSSVCAVVWASYGMLLSVVDKGSAQFSLPSGSPGLSKPGIRLSGITDVFSFLGGPFQHQSWK